MNNLKVLLLICAMLIAAPSAVAQSYYQLWYDGAPVSGSNQLPVDATVSVTVSGITTLDSITDPVGIKGADGAAITSATNSFPIRVSADGTNYVSATHGLYFNILQGNAVVSASNTLPVRPSADGTNPVDATHGLYFNTLQGNAVISATNGTFANILQGNAVISATHGLFTNILQGDAVVSASNPLPAQLSLAGVAVSAGVPLPVTVISGGGVSLVGVKGEDGTTIATTVNPLDVKFTNSGVNVLWVDTPAAQNTPLPVAIYTGDAGSNIVGVLGEDATTISSGSNPLPASIINFSTPVGIYGENGSGITTQTNPLSARLTDGTNFIDDTHPLPVSAHTFGNSSTTSVNDSIANTDTAVSLGGPCETIDIWTDVGSSDIYIQIFGTSTTSNAKIAGGGTYHYHGKATSSFNYIGAGTTGKINYVAY